MLLLRRLVLWEFLGRLWYFQSSGFIFNIDKMAWIVPDISFLHIALNLLNQVKTVILRQIIQIQLFINRITIILLLCDHFSFQYWQRIQIGALSRYLRMIQWLQTSCHFSRSSFEFLQSLVQNVIQNSFSRRLLTLIIVASRKHSWKYT